VLGGSQKFFWDTLQLFSSFLRGASCPKSPRVAATAASLFILDTPRFVKGREAVTDSADSLRHTHWQLGAVKFVSEQQPRLMPLRGYSS